MEVSNRRIIFTREQALEIREARKNNKDKNAERRLSVLCMKMEGKALDEIVAKTGYNPTYARSLVTKYFAEGIRLVIGKKRHANHRNISFEEESAFVNDFSDCAQKGELITVKDIKAAYEAKVGHKIGNGHIYITWVSVRRD